jgi:hypothetical protein
MAEPPPRTSRLPFALVGAAVAFNLWALRAEVRDVWYLNDSGIHASMVRWAADRIQAGHLPLDGWYPYLSLGASRFHHYQSLPHILTGAVSVLAGPSVFRWSLYLLLCTWPVAVYVGGRLLDLKPWEAGVAALVSPLIVSAPSLGFEWSSYVWRGSGTWAQLWGMWALPVAWGASWRAVIGRGSLAVAALVVGLTICLHLLIGYLALLSLVVWVVLSPGELVRRLGRAALIGAGALLVAAWMLVPLIADASWTTQDEFSRGRFYYDSFGARRVLGWLVTGRIFDDGRVPVVSVLALAGLVVFAWESRRREPARAVLGVGLLSLLLFFGRPTVGFAIDLLPGASDLFLRRYVTGVHLAGIYLAGVGGARAGAWLLATVPRRLAWLRPGLAVAGVGALAVALLSPAMVERYGYERRGAGWIAEQRADQVRDGADFASLVAAAHAAAPGRLFGSMRSDPSAPEIGQVQTFAALLNLDADGVGFTRPTWSLMSNIEARFSIEDPALDRMFGVRWAVLPAGNDPPDGAVKTGSAGRWVLWSIGETGYLDVVDTAGSISADRTDLGQRTAPFLRSDLPAERRYPTVAFGGRPAPPPSLSAGEEPTEPPGRVLAERSDPADGTFDGSVELDRPAVVLVSASFDPRWRATVDGRPVPTQMVAPALVGAPVGPGVHRVAFRYEPVSSYPVLFALGVGALVALIVVDRRRFVVADPPDRYAPSAADSRGA